MFQRVRILALNCYNMHEKRAMFWETRSFRPNTFVHSKLSYAIYMLGLCFLLYDILNFYIYFRCLVSFMLNSKCLLRSSIALLFLTGLCNGERGLNSTGSSVHNDTRPVQCGFVGDSDVPGIGIRIGYYTQALSVWFANYFILSEAKALRSINLLFLVALFIGLVWLSHRPEGTHAIEVFLLLRLLFATWYVGVLDRSKFSEKHWRKSYMWVVIRECSLLGLLSYAVWIAWIGFDHLEKTPCGTFVFFIVKVSLYG